MKKTIDERKRRLNTGIHEQGVYLNKWKEKKKEVVSNSSIVFGQAVRHRVAFPPRLEAPVIRDRHRVRTTKNEKKESKIWCL